MNKKYSVIIFVVCEFLYNFATWIGGSHEPLTRVSLSPFHFANDRHYFFDRQIMEEIWKPIGKLVRFDSNYNIVKTFDYKGTCFVSSNGRVRLPNGNISKTKPDKLGYTTVKLGNERFKVQQIMMQTFYPEEIRTGVSVDHIDRNPRNNNLHNLRWADTKLQTRNRENKKYKYKKVLCLNNGIIYNSCQEAEYKLGLVHNTVSRVARGERNSIHGYTFVFFNEIHNKDSLQEMA